MVMPTNGSYPWLHYWAGRASGCVGHLYSPKGQRGPYQWLPYALDNGAFAGFDEGEWKALLRWACLSGAAPLWVAVPDVVGDAKATSAQWDTYSPEASRFGWPLAFVVQDGHEPADVPGGADVIFVGGSTEWKWASLDTWCAAYDRVHVGRVNSPERLYQCHRLGVESVDGTGWGRGDSRQLAGLLRYLEETTPPQP